MAILYFQSFLKSASLLVVHLMMKVVKYVIGFGALQHVFLEIALNVGLYHVVISQMLKGVLLASE